MPAGGDFVPGFFEAGPGMLRFKASDWLRPSVLVLVGANLYPVYAVLFSGWTVFAVLLLYWLENVIVGCFNVLRMLFAAGGRDRSPAARVATILFFMVHYGGFAAGHGLFLIVVFGGTSQQGSVHQTLAQVVGFIYQEYLGYALLALVASHGFSFFWNYLWQGEYRRVSPGELMGRPYTRVVVLHLVIIFGALPVALFHAPAPALVLLVAFKIGIDVTAHLYEHEGMGAIPIET
jgi:hypothetical protein